MKTDFVEIFQSIRAAMQPYETLGFNTRVNSDKDYDLWSERNVVIDGRKKTEVYFAGVKIFKNHVGFYFMPVYAQPDMQTVFHPDLLKLLKGRSCFHIKQLDDILLAQIADALDKGYKIYRQKEWI